MCTSTIEFQTLQCETSHISLYVETIRKVVDEADEAEKCLGC